ncbi:MAG: ribonuclease J [Clostridiales bacterium]|nr:ribonuclease J [Clostridiales bacterium]MCF8023738.1 ribonuclease J [Clostridiales bacterium]
MNNYKEKALSVIPLGGISEIGKNMMAFEYGDDIIIIDAGIKFPTEELPGVDLVIPDITYLKENIQKIHGIILTHGHEDHVGALPFILEELNVPIYGTSLTIGIAKRKLTDRDVKNINNNRFDLNVIDSSDELKLGSFKINFFRVNHSIPDGVGLAIRTPAGLVVHSGDFKIDHTPVDGKVMELNKLSRWGSHGILLFICDTTNAGKEGYTPSEKIVGETLYDVFGRCEKRIIVTTFASNVHRLQQIINVAADFNRRVALSGRSMINVVDVASELGYLHIPEGTLVEIEEANKLSPDRVVIITTGSQGEPMAALTRMALKSHRLIQIQPDDTVIISASPIPGNEKLIARTIDNLFRIGANVVYKVDGDVHVSGHASNEEIKILIKILNPKYVLPFHGEYRHKISFSHMAEDLGIPKENVILAEQGDRWEFYRKMAKHAGKVKTGEIMVDGLGIGDVGNIVLHDRQTLSTEGIIIVVIVIDKKTGMLMAGPEIVTRGFVYMRENVQLINNAKSVILKELKNLNSKQFKNWSHVKGVITKTLFSFVLKHIGRKPFILPIVTEYQEE